MVEGDQGERVLRSEHHVPQLALMDVSMLPSRKRKTLTPQQLEERRKEVSPCTAKGRKIWRNCCIILMWHALPWPRNGRTTLQKQRRCRERKKCHPSMGWY